MVTAPPSGLSATELVAAGRDHVNHGSPARAVACYRQALDQLAEAPTDPATDRLRARAHLGLALAEADRSGDAVEGMAHLAAAEDVLPHDADDLRAALLGQRGILLIHAGRLEDALATFVSAEDVLGRTTPSHRASMVLNRGLLHLELGHGDAARADFERAIVEAGVADQPRTAYKARHNLACVAFLEGDLPLAIDGMASAPDHHDGTVEDPDPITLMDRGRVLLEAGLVEEADELLGRAQHHFEADQRGRDLGEAALFRADAALVGGHLERAASLADTAVADFTVGRNERWRRRAELVALAVDDQRMVADDTPADDPGPARSDLRRRALALADEATDDDEVAATARLIAVEAALGTGDRDTATREFDEVGLPATASLRLRLRWHLARATMAGPDEVQQVVEAGVAELVTAQAQVGSRDLRTAMALHGRALVERGVAAAMVGGDVAALHRAVDLAHAASTRLTPVRADLDADERRLLAELRAVENRQWREPDAAADVRGAADARAAGLRERLRQRSWQRQGHRSHAAAPVADAHEWGRTLAQVAAVGCSFFAVGPELHVLRTTPAGTDAVALGPARPVMDLVQRLRADLRVLVLPGLAPPMQVAVRASLADSLARLDEAIGIPLDAAGRDLVVVPHGALALLPWSLVPSRRGAATTAAASATGWLRAHRRGVVARDVVEVRALAGPDLERAIDEVAGVASTWGGGPDGRLATTDDLRAALAEADVVHLAAHGTHRRESPLFSSVRLADGALFAHELVADARARLVVLSSCDVGEQAVRPGDEPLGLAAALLEMGVATVVGSVAPIRDDVAARVGQRLHGHLVTGMPVARAVCEVVAEAAADGEVAPLVVLGGGLRPVVAGTGGGPAS